MKATLVAGLLAAILWGPAAAAVPACSVRSGTTLVPLVELYTSEGCSSCPPADRWLSATFPASASAPAAAVLAFHVDYWDRLGWTDRFAQPAFTARQYAAMRANGATFVYTPQVLLQGKDVPPGRRGRMADDVARAARAAPQATIAIDAGAIGAGASVRVRADVAPGRPDAQLWLAQADSDHATHVKAGENRGVRLAHDHVVRALHGPFAADARGVAEAAVSLADVRERGGSPVLVAFVQDARSGALLQSLVLPLASDCVR